MTSKLKNNHLNLFVMLNLLEIDSSFVFLALIATEIWYFIFFLKCVGGHFEYHTCQSENPFIKETIELIFFYNASGSQFNHKKGRTIGIMESMELFFSDNASWPAE